MITKVATILRYGEDDAGWGDEKLIAHMTATFVKTTTVDEILEEERRLRVIPASMKERMGSLSKVNLIGIHYSTRHGAVRCRSEVVVPLSSIGVRDQHVSVVVKIMRETLHGAGYDVTSKVG